MCCVCLVLLFIYSGNKDRAIQVTAGSVAGTHEAPHASNREVLQFLNNVRIEKISLKDDAFEDVVKFLIRKINANPEAGQVDFIVRVSNASVTRKESLVLENVTAFEALKVIGEKYQVSVVIDKRAVIFDRQ